ncbi:MAG: sigma 54-interacting transcriptional regulator, partial [Aquabacterium sp.]|nr:sigma 54-interacting transcriptional regulator [Aquabacterium sp.]
GHERGAFTGAQAARRGRFEQADGGTLFLDEIGDMPFDLQTRLLRVLSDGQFYRVGGHHPQKANVRVIAATHQNLEQRVREGAFREDLFHRLNVIRLRLPPLRERRDDIPGLTRHFLARSARELGVEAKRITDGAVQRLASFDFPGNVRQLENVCHWLTVMAPAQVVEAKDLPPELLLSGAAPPHAGASVGLAVHPMGAALADEQTAPVDAAGTGDSRLARSAAADGDAARGAMPTSTEANAGAGPRPTPATGAAWLADLQAEAQRLLEAGDPTVWDQLTRQFEAALILTALKSTRGRRIEAAHKLGIGRNTITRKIQELGLDE